MAAHVCAHGINSLWKTLQLQTRPVRSTRNSFRPSVILNFPRPSLSTSICRPLLMSSANLSCAAFVKVCSLSSAPIRLSANHFSIILRAASKKAQTGNFLAQTRREFQTSAAFDVMKLYRRTGHLTRDHLVALAFFKASIAPKIPLSWTKLMYL